MIQLSISARPVADMDSLELVLKKLPDSSKLVHLKELAYLAKGKNLKMYAVRLLQEAERQGNTDYKGDALFVLVRYYYVYNVDSMRLLIKEAEPLFLEKGRLEDLFRMKAWNIYACTKRGENDDALRETELLNKLAAKLGYPEGKEMADQALADYYYKNKLRKESLALCEDLFQRLEARDAPLIKRVNVIRQMLNMNTTIVDEKTCIYYLDKLHTYITKCEQEGIVNMDAENSVSYMKYFYHRSYAHTAYSMKNAELMRIHLDEAEHLATSLSVEDKRALASIKIIYYEMIGQYEKALTTSNELLPLYRQRNQYYYILTILYQQATFHHHLGDDASAVACYNEYITLNDSVSSLKYYEDLARYKAQHDEDKQILKIKQLELDASNGRIWVMAGIVFVLLIVCGFLFYIVRAHKRYNRRLKRAKEKAEESDRLKSAFLANINHEIRTPLNAIIGFSEILIDEEEEDLRRQYVDVIRENNGILQQLIDGILSVSNIESGTVVFNNTRVELLLLMNDVSRVVTSRVSGDVTLNYIPGPEVEIKTDPVYLGKVLVSLLSFAVYRTREGRIRYGYTLQKDTISLYVQCPDAVMTAEEQTTIFDYNRMLESWTEGVGLGVNLELGVAKNTIDRMGGTLSLEIEEEKGFTFLVTFPFLRH